MRRRRECSACGERFTTYEYVEERPIQVLKREGEVEEFDRGKLLRSVQVACAKRPVSASQAEEIVDEIEDTISRRASPEVKSAHIGEMVMERLKPLDRVAYVRFASVYKDFQDPDEFREFVEEMNVRSDREARARSQVELPLPGE